MLKEHRPVWQEIMEREAGPRVAHEVAGIGLLGQHFRRPAERPFTVEERDHVTILFGGLTWKHEKLIQAGFQGCGYRCQPLSIPAISVHNPAVSWRRSKSRAGSLEDGGEMTLPIDMTKDGRYR